MADKTVFVDVDGTLLLWPGRRPGRVPRVGEEGYGQSPRLNTVLIVRLRTLAAEGWTIVVWSREGARHAEEAARLCEIHRLVRVTLSKPHLIIDNQGERWYEGIKVETPDGK